MINCQCIAQFLVQCPCQSFLEKTQAARDPKTKEGTERVHQTSRPTSAAQTNRAFPSGGALGRMPRAGSRECVVKKAQWVWGWAWKPSGREAAPSLEKSKLKSRDRCTTVLEKSPKKGKDTQHGISLCLDQEKGIGAIGKHWKEGILWKNREGCKRLCTSPSQ